MITKNYTPEELYRLHVLDNSPLYVCRPFLQKLPEQCLLDEFLLLLPGRLLVAQCKAWTRCPDTGPTRLRNMAAATCLASFKTLTSAQQEHFRLADKESMSVNFSNGSIILVATSEKRISVSDSLIHLPWTKLSYKVTAANPKPLFWEIFQSPNTGKILQVSCSLVQTKLSHAPPVKLKQSVLPTSFPLCAPRKFMEMISSWLSRKDVL
jgi:hypothetical protein